MRTTQTNTTEKSFDELIEICKEYSSMIETVSRKFSTSVVLTPTTFDRNGGET